MPQRVNTLRALFLSTRGTSWVCIALFVSRVRTLPVCEEKAKITSGDFPTNGHYCKRLGETNKEAKGAIVT